MRTRVWSLVFVMVLGAAADADAQPIDMSMENPKFLSFGSGDLVYRTFTYASLVGQDAKQAYFIPGAGFPAEIYVATANNDPGWMQMVNARGWNGYATDWVGCGRAEEPPTDDLVELVDKAIYGVYQMGVATSANLAVAKDLGCAFLIKAISLDDRFNAAGVLIDPTGPRGAQPRVHATAESILARQASLEDVLWTELSLGPRPGRVHEGLDLTTDQAKRIVRRYERDQPGYWAAVHTDFDGELEVREPLWLENWPVLIVRTAAASPEQIVREEAVAQWLTEQGALVERLELASLGLAHSGLPMLGENAEAILNHFIDWAESKQ